MSKKMKINSVDSSIEDIVNELSALMDKYPLIRYFIVVSDGTDTGMSGHGCVKCFTDYIENWAEVNEIEHDPVETIQ